MMKGLLALLLVALACGIAAEEPLNVFIIPHSHCDPGWLNTFQGYFHDQVNRILSGVTEQLLMDSKRKFVWAEISFFHLWWEQQSQDTRDNVKSLVKSGQFEFVAGGWVQNDEANANFDIVIDQVTEGHDFLHRVFGVVPRVAWQIDPFGHSSLTPSLFARMGFEGLVINRIHYGLKDSFKRSRSMEFLWTGSQSLGNESELFTHVLHTHYSAPQGYDWEEGHGVHVSSSNVASRASDFANMAKNRANAYRTRNLLIPFGDDFKFQNAGFQFSNMDQIIAELNRGSSYGVKAQYGTVSDYFEAVSKSSRSNQVQFPTYNGDFFPYADNEDSYWTGYYTTRPTLKSHSRGTDSILRAAEGMYALGRTLAVNDPKLNDAADWDGLFDGLRTGRRNTALVQHHDGITGTAKQFVADDYAARLSQAREASFETMKEMAQIILTDKETPSLSYDLKTFSFDSGEEVYAIVVHNPLGWIRRKYIKLRVTIPEVSVMSHAGVNLESQVLPVVDIDSLDQSVSEYELYFLIEVPPLGTRTYFLSKSKSAGTRPLASEYFGYSKNFNSQMGTKLSRSADIQIENEHYVVKFEGDTGLIEWVRNKDNDFDVTLNQQFVDYKTSRSGAYIMRPDNQMPIYSGDRNPIKLIQITGPLVSQVCTYIYANQNDPSFESSMCVRVFSTKSITNTPNILEVGGYLEVVYSVVGRRNSETVMRYNTNLSTGRNFYTDNGLEIRERKGEGQKTESHYYPNLSYSYLLDADKGIQFTILSRQAMGTHSRDNGQIEQMMHRALAQDDGRGLGEPNNDFSRNEVVVYLVVQPLEPSVRMGRRLALALQHQPRLLHGDARGGPKAWAAKYKPFYFPFSSQLPHNVHLASFKARDSVSDDIILRLLHIFEKGQHSTYSEPKEVELNKLLEDFTFDSRRERSLAMSLDVVEGQARRPTFLASPEEKLNHASGTAPQFVTQDNQNTEEEGVFISQAALDDKKKLETANPLGRQLKALDLTPVDVVFLQPMQIKSFFVQLSPKGNTAARPNPPNPQADPPARDTPTEEPIDIQPPAPEPVIPETPPPGLPADQQPVTPTQSRQQQWGDGIIPSPPAKPPTRIRPTSAPGSRTTPSPEHRPLYAEVSEVEMRAFFAISIVGTALVILAYIRLRAKRNRTNLQNGGFGIKRNGKGLIEV